MPALLLLLQGVEHAGGEEGFTPFSINTGLIFWTILVFLILLGVLWRLGWPAILTMVEERERRIQRQLEDAARANAEAARLLEEHKKALSTAHAEAQALVAKAMAVAQKERETLLAKAREEADQLLARARKEIGEEKQKAILELRREATDLALAAASKLLEAKIDTEANRRLVMDYLATLEHQR